MTPVPTFPTYRLNFRSPLHVGARGVGQEVTRTYVPADTLFSAVCFAWRELYGVDLLRRDLLDLFVNADTGNEPFFLMSAFPFVSDIRFFPRPLGAFTNVAVGESDEKAFRRIQFVSERVFEGVVNREALMFRKEDCVNGEVAWVTSEERSRLSEWTDDATGDIVLWKSTVVPRVTLDRITSASEIWHFGEVRFADGAGLWFAVDFNGEYGNPFRGKFDACLRVLGDMGIGGERGAGHGLFNVSRPMEDSLPGSNDTNRFVTLSPLCPKDAAQAGALTGNGAAYELIPRRGWVASPEANNLRRKTIWMFAEGSVLTGGPEPRAGRLVNVKPDVCPHDVWRYGYAFPIKVKT